MNEELNQLLEQLKAARAEQDIAKAFMDSSLKAFMSSDDVYSYNKAVKERADEKIILLETEIRAIGLQEFLNSGEKKFHPKLEVKEFRVVKLVTEKSSDLREWLFANFRPALVVDEKKVVDAAKEGNIPAEFYTAALEPRVQIAKEL